MHVQRLRVSGFKSFADPVDLRIEPGLTGVVGPNGCGKSNLLEALRWVMGAASAKAMRADGMDEVIFGGSGAGSGGGSRPARNHAEVALQLDNSDRTAPAAFNDAAVIEVTRRIDRGQGSTYRVNGAEARARDVQLLFADASTGANSPSLVRQGQISELIAAKPSNRRRILEEAAGVSGLHGRRHEAELRLRAAEANLERLDDLARELESGVGRLRREARQAETYRRLGAEIRTLQAASALARFTEADSAQADAGEALTTAEARAAITAGEAARAEATALSVGEALPRLREEEMVAAAVLQRLAIERDRLERDLEALRAEVARAQGEAKRLAADAQREEAAAADAANARERLTMELKGLEAQVAAAPTRLPQLEAALAAAERARGEADAAVERLAAEAAAAEAGRRAAAERLASAATARRAAAGRLAEAQSRCERVSTALDAARREAACAAAPADDGAAAAALAAAQAALDDARAALESAEAEHAVAREAETAARDAARRRDDALRILRAEAEGLVRAAAAPAAAFPPALDRVRPAKGYEAALAAALGDELNAALDQAAPAHWAGGEARAPEWPRGAEPLAAKLDAPPELAARLALVAVVGREDGERLRRLVPVGARLVSREGDLWRWDGFTVRAEAPRPAAVRLQQRARLADLQAQAAAAEPQARAATDAHGAARDALAAADLRLRAARAAPPSAERALAAARGAVERLEREAEREASRRQAAAATMERLSGDLAEAQAARDRAAEEDAEAAAALAAAGSAAPAPTPADDRRLAEARHGAQAARQAEAAARSALDAERAAQKGRARRGETLAREVADWSRRLAAARARSDEIARDGERARAALARLRDAPAEADGRRARLLDEVAVAERRRADSADALAVAEATRGEAERLARAAAAAAADAREARAGAAARLDAVRDRRAAAEAEVERVTGADPATLAARLATEAVAAPPDPAALQAHLETLTLQRDRLGAVNLRAEEELSEAAARLEAMRADRADLTSAMAKLRLGVDALNAEGRERVLAAFATIDRSFRDLFAALFEGGEARLELVESDDPLEAGLEIFACPPGKRLATMSLMSGGEQALTACALIFAVFLANPAPLCVLDEVDAPLDDANVDRFCRLLDEMRRLTDTRFLAITHNPVTMSRMDRLYGVTMPERGVSQLVSVDLKRAEALVAAG